VPRTKKTRVGNGESTIYLGSDGYWHARISLGTRDDGKPDRRHVQATTRASVVKKLRELERRREQGRVPSPGQRWTVAQWLEHWLEHISKPSVRENTWLGYRVDVRVHLVPGVGAHKLEALAPQHLERLYAKIQRAGGSAATAHHVHRTVRTALGEAERRGYLNKNPAAVARPPRLEEHEVEPFTVEEIQRLLEAAFHRRNGARWAVALALGLRQGEALGLRWEDVDLESGTLMIRRARQRPRWDHGCDGSCGHKFGGHCPKRRPLRTDTAPTKSSAGRRAMGLPDQLVQLLTRHREEQQAERELAGSLWQEGGWVFTTPTGSPLNPRTDYTHWKELLVSVGLRDARLHDARHTAATVLLLLGVPDRAVMGIMGWSKADMMVRYQHLTGAVRQDMAARLGGLLWTAAAPPSGHK
jgi:integrase